MGPAPDHRAGPDHDRCGNTDSAACYALRQRAAALGWSAAQIITIDTNQGHSGASATDRESFQHLIAEVGMGPGWDRARPGGIPAGSQQRRLAPAAGDLRADLHADRTGTGLEAPSQPRTTPDEASSVAIQTRLGPSTRLGVRHRRVETAISPV